MNRKYLNYLLFIRQLHVQQVLHFLFLYKVALPY